jgi:hypothetical protein
MRPSSLYLTFGAALLICVAVGYAGVRTHESRTFSPPATASSTHTSRLQVTGNVEGLYPGRQMWIELRVRNRYSHSITVRSIRVRVGDASPACLGSNLKTSRRHLKRVIPPHSKRRVRLRIEMAPNAANACQGATFPLKFRARARG